MDFATNFKRLCEERGTSPTRVCLDIGLSSSKVNLWNKGSVPKGDVLVKLAEKLECNIMEFFDDGTGKYATEFALDEDERDIIRLYRTLDRKTKHEFMAQAYLYEKSLHEGESD